MKKLLCIIMSAVMALMISACSFGGQSDNAVQEGVAVETIKNDKISLVGVWEFEDIYEGDSNDFMNKALKSILRQNVKKGMRIEFKEEGVANIGGIDVNYKLDGDNLKLTWDESKNFNFKLNGNNTEIKIEMSGVMTAVLKRK